jgi:ABC-type branched-subunit amino acid transport system ATPase component
MCRALVTRIEVRPVPDALAAESAVTGAQPGGGDLADRPLLAVQELDVSYGGSVRALHAVSLSVPDGAIAAVLGGNGAGKSTLLRTISGTLPYTGGSIVAGTVEFAGRRLNGADAAAVARAGVVQVPEGRRIFAELTVAENLRAGGLPLPRRSRASARERVYDLFPVLWERRRQRAGLLSGGEQQMLAIGRALMAKPQLLLLDEPSLGLAPQMMNRIADIVVEINRQGTTVVLVEQNAAMALRISDTAFVLEAGRLALHGPARDLADSDEVRDRYLGIADAAAGPVSPDASERPARQSAGSTTRHILPAVRAAGAPGRRRRADERPDELSVAGLTVRFGGILALQDVSFTVAPGSVHALIGPNGAGKSTCLNVLNGVYRASAGSVRYADHELTRLTPHRIARLGVSRTFQNTSLSVRETVADNLLLARHRLMRGGFAAAGLRLPRARRDDIAHREQIGRVAELLNLAEYLRQPVNVLPHGMRKRVELARALCAEPGLLLMDEPVAGMTAEESAAMARAISAVRREFGISLLVVEHDMTFVMGIADHVTVLDFGRRIADGTPAEVRRDPEVLRAYLGSDGEVDG